MDREKRRLQKGLMKKLIQTLNDASDSYYNSGHPIMTDKEFDFMYDELQELEKDTGITLANSPTNKVGAEVKSELKTVKHNHPMLSLDKCHTVDELIKFAGDEDTLLMLKLDGLSLTLQYLDGKLVSARTRGNGEEGTDVLHNVMTFENVPKTIPYENELIIDGEVIITYPDFELINKLLPYDKKYKNPRNLASGSMTLLDSKIATKRRMRFVAWKVIKGLNEIAQNDSSLFKLKELEKLGFDIVPMWTYSNNSSDKDNISEMLSNLRVRAENLGYPIDGAVLTIDSVAKGELMGRTSKFFRHSIAYKFEDDKHQTELLDVEWTMGRSGVLTPTAIFKPCEIDGTTVSRASLHNISIMEQLDLKIGCTVNVIKANSIIPQIESAEPYDGLEILTPEHCPICNSNTVIKSEISDTKTLHCGSSNCQGKLLGRLSHFVSKNAMNIDGLSEKTLERLIDEGFINNLYDIYNIKDYKHQIERLEGFGKKSVDNLMTSIDNSKRVRFENFLYALGIPLIGRTASKTIGKQFHSDNESFKMMIDSQFDFRQLDDFGEKMHQSIYNWFDNEYNLLTYNLLSELVEFEVADYTTQTVQVLADQSICITGKLTHYSNRSALVADIEIHGGKVASGVTSKTNFLLTNDKTSGSSKNKKANELGIPIITEQDFIKMIGGD